MNRGTASKLRALVVPPAPAKAETDATHSHREHPPTHRSRYRPWAELLKRTFQIDVEQCPNCGGRLKLRAPVIEAHTIALRGQPGVNIIGPLSVTEMGFPRRTSRTTETSARSRPSVLQDADAAAQVLRAQLSSSFSAAPDPHLLADWARRRCI